MTKREVSGGDEAGGMLGDAVAKELEKRGREVVVIAPLLDVIREARIDAGLQADGRPAGHGGGCRCAECRAVEGP